MRSTSQFTDPLRRVPMVYRVEAVPANDKLTGRVMQHIFHLANVNSRVTIDPATVAHLAGHEGVTCSRVHVCIDELIRRGCLREIGQAPAGSGRFWA